MTDDGADRPITRAIGDEIRRTRDSQGWTRAELVDRLSVDITVQALANYEYGVRPCTVERFVEICDALNVSAPSLLGLALQRAGIALYTNEIQVNLRAIAENKDAALKPLRTWARNRLAIETDGSGVARIDQVMVEQWAIMLGISRTDFIGHLLSFTPGITPPCP